MNDRTPNAEDYAAVVQDAEDAWTKVREHREQLAAAADVLGVALDLLNKAAEGG